MKNFLIVFIISFIISISAYAQVAKVLEEKKGDPCGMILPGKEGINYLREICVLEKGKLKLKRCCYSLVEFTGVYFASKADFKEAHFASRAFFYGAHFASGADFREAHFAYSANSAGFLMAHFASKADFKEAHFASGADFGGAQFASTADFLMVHFASKAEFIMAHFDSTANFKRAHFASKADFTSTSFKGPVSFSHAILPDSLFLIGTTIENTFDLSYARLKNPAKVCHLILYNTEIDHLKFDYSYYTLIYDDSVLLRKIGSKLTPQETERIYENIIKQQEKYNFTSGVKKAKIDLYEFKRKGSHTSWYDSFFLLLNKAWNYYGFEKWRILPYTIFFFLCFLVINVLTYKTLITHVYRIPKLYADLRKRRNKEYSYFFPAVYFTALVFFGLRMDIDNIELRNKSGITYLFFMYTVGLVCLAFLVNFIVTE